MADRQAIVLFAHHPRPNYTFPTDLRPCDQPSTTAQCVIRTKFNRLRYTAPISHPSLGDASAHQPDGADTLERRLAFRRDLYVDRTGIVQARYRRPDHRTTIRCSTIRARYVSTLYMYYQCYLDATSSLPQTCVHY